MNGQSKGKTLMAIFLVFALAAIAAPAAQASKSISFSFGSPGKGDGQFETPKGIAVNDSTGQIYVVDEGNNRIERFSEDGVYEAQWGSLGTGAGQFDHPQGVAIDQDSGDVYVTDRENIRVQRFDAAGSFQLMWGRDVLKPGAPGETVENAQRTISLEGSPTNGTFELGFGETATAPISYNAPATGLGSIQEALESLPSINPGDVSVSGPTGGPWKVAFEGAYAATAVGISAFDENFEPASARAKVTADLDGGPGPEVCTVAADCKAGISGIGPGEFGAPLVEEPPRSTTPRLAISPPDGNSATGSVFVADSGGVEAPSRVQQFTLDGGYTGQFGEFGGRGLGFINAFFPKFLTVDSAGIVYFANFDGVLGDIVGRYDTSTGTFLPSLAPPLLYNPGFSGAPTAGLAVDSAGHLYVARAPYPAESETLITLIQEFATPGGTPTLVDTHLVGFGMDTVNDIAVDGEGRIYLTSTSIGNPPTEAQRVYVLDNVADPELTIEAASEVSATGATFKGTVDPNKAQTSFHFEYSRNGTNWASLPSEDAGKGEVPVAVTGKATGLVPNSTYQLRLVANRPFGGSGSTILAGPSFLTPKTAPSVEDFPPKPDTTSAVLRARVNPNNLPTTYRFQYDTDSGYSSPGVVPMPDRSAGSGIGPIVVAELATGLKADTIYHYRLIATSSAGATIGPDRTFHTLAGKRAYELVSPPNKQGGDIATWPMRMRIASDGNAITFMSPVSFGDVSGAGFKSEYMSVRGLDGWTTHGISPLQGSLGVRTAPIPGDTQTLFAAISEDLTKGVAIAATPLTAEGPNVQSVANLYLRTDLRSAGAGSYQLLSNCTNTTACKKPLAANVEETVALAATSEDFNQILFESKYNLLAGAIGAQPKLYEWDEGTLRLAGILPDTACAKPPCVATVSVAGQGAGVGGAGQFTNYTQPHHTERTISADGSKVFFTASPFAQTAGGGGSGALYMRQSDTTTKLNVSEREIPDPEVGQPAAFQTASKDGSRVFFITEEALTDDDTNNVADLYMYDTTKPASDPHNLTLISKDSVGSPGKDAADGVVGTSDDGRYVYFTGHSRLLAGQPAVSEDAVFVWHEGNLRYLGDATTGGTANNTVLTYSYALFKRSVVTPDGHTLVFSTAWDKNLTGYDASNPSLCKNSPCTQIYAYDYDTDKLSCASCLTTPAQPADRIGENADGGLYGGTTTYLSHIVSDDGRTVLFSTPGSLVPEDTNGRRDVYEYDVESEQVRLVSTGQCDCDSYAIGLSADGRDAFFTTRQRLVGIDFDSSADLYDARIGGGIASQNPVAPTECLGDACLGGVRAPGDVTPASAGFSGAGNPAPKAHKKKAKKAHKHKHKRQRAKRAGAKRGGSK